MEFDTLKLLTKPVSSRAVIEVAYLDVAVKEGVFPSGAFSLALPLNWRSDRDQPDAIPDTDNPVVPLARFSPGTEDALGADAEVEIVVWAAALTREIHGADWLHQWITSQGFKTIDARELPTKFGIMGDALAVREVDGQTMLHRLYVIKDGDLIFLIDGRAKATPGLDAKAFQEIVLMAMIRFRLLAASGQVYAEPFEALAMSGSGGAIALIAPQSWTRSDSDDAPVGGAAMVLSNTVGAAVVGSIVVAFGNDRDDVKVIEDATLEKFRNQGYAVTAPGRVLVERSAEGARYDVVRYEGSDFAVLSARMVIGEKPVSVILLTPSDLDAFEAWAVNRRAFDIVVGSITVE